jgi:hypothetical protein
MDSGTPLKNGTKAGSDHLPEMVRRSADRYGMFAPDQALLVAVSGGVAKCACVLVWPI